MKVSKFRLTGVIGITVALAAMVFIPRLSAQGDVQPYYSGDAAVYGGTLTVASTDSGALEVFTLGTDGLRRVSKTAVPSQGTPLKGAEKFYDVALRAESGGLYAYAVNGRYLAKYDITNPAAPQLREYIKDNSWDWFLRVDVIDDYLVTVGTKGVKLWNAQLQVVNAFANNDKHAAIALSGNGDWLTDIKTDADGNAQRDYIQLVNTNTRGVFGEYPIVLERTHDRGVHFATDRGLVYVAGDRVLKQINTVTSAVANFAHTSSEGYAVDGVAGANHFYFTDGLGVVKMDHSLKALDWLYVSELKMPQAWAMGLKVVPFGAGERVVVFNNTSIVVLDEHLKPLATYRSTEAVEPVVPSEPLAINLSTHQVGKGGVVTVNGTGYGANETVTITFVKDGRDLSPAQAVKTDANGRFSATVTVPQGIPNDFPDRVVRTLPVRVEVRAQGTVSGLQYGTSFTITE